MKEHVRETLNTTVENILTTLREIECDEVDTQGIMENSIYYLISNVLNVVYGSNVTDRYTAIGVIDVVKQHLTHPGVPGYSESK